MKRDIVKFVKEACSRFNLQADYITEKDLYRITKRGRVVMAFYGDTYYQVPREARKRHILPMIKKGLSHNLGESYYNQMWGNHGGKKIC